MGRLPKSTNNADVKGAYAAAAADTRSLVRTSLKAALATFDAGGPRSMPTPYASLVTTATSAAGAPTLLISNLARHTKNLQSNARGSILFDGTGASGDPLAGGRATLVGSFAPTKDPNIARRFLNRHPESEMYASFADFSFYEMDVESAHFIGGFGRIIDIARDDLVIYLDGAEELMEAEAAIVAHMNKDHLDALALYATEISGADPHSGPWRMSGIDPSGFDIIGQSEGHRIEFTSRVTSPNLARMAFKALAQRARGQA